MPRFSELPDFSADALLQLRLVGDLHGLAVIVNLAVVELSLHFGDLLEAGRRSAPLDDLPGLCIVPEAAGFSGLHTCRRRGGLLQKLSSRSDFSPFS